MRPKVAWQVGPEDGDRVRDVLRKLAELGADGHGRVLLNGRTAEPDDTIEVGDRVELWPARAAVDAQGVSILAHRDGVLVANKPAGLPTETTQLGEDSLVTRLMQRLETARVHAASRLDTAVSGAVLCTLGGDAARRLQLWRQRGQLERGYLAMVHGDISERCEWNVPLGRSRDGAGRHKAVPHGSRARRALTGVRPLAVTEPPGSALRASLLELRPVTGRMHQLRAHAAWAHAPIYGDRLYGGTTTVADATGHTHALSRIALHASCVRTPTLSVLAPVPPALTELWRWLGGRDDDWPSEAD